MYNPVGVIHSDEGRVSQELTCKMFQQTGKSLASLSLLGFLSGGGGGTPKKGL